MASCENNRDADPGEIRRDKGKIDLDYLAYLKTGFVDLAAKKGEPGAAEQDEPGVDAAQDESEAVEPVDPEYMIFLNSLVMINNFWHVKADEGNKLAENYILEVVSDGELDRCERVNMVGGEIDDELPFSPKMVSSVYKQSMKRKTEDGTDYYSAYNADPNHSEDEKNERKENIPAKQGGNTENCSPRPSEVFHISKRMKLEVDNMDEDLMLYLDSYMRGNLKSPSNIASSKPRSPKHIRRSPEHIGSFKPRYHAHMGSSKIKSPEHIPSIKRESLAHTGGSKIKSPEYYGSSKIKVPEYTGRSKLKSPAFTGSSIVRSPEYTGSSKRKSSVHITSSKVKYPVHVESIKPDCLGPKPDPSLHIRRSISNYEPPEHIQISNMNGGGRSGIPMNAPHFRAVKSEVRHLSEDDVDEGEDLVCLGSPSAETSPFRENLLRVLSKPYNSLELQRLEEEAILKKKVGKLVDLRSGREKFVATEKDGKALIDHYPDLRRKLAANGNDSRKRLKLLRGFFFWIQHLTQDRAFQPWLDKTMQ